MKPNVSHDLVKDLTVKIADAAPTEASTILSNALKASPKTVCSLAACITRMRKMTMPN